MRSLLPVEIRLARPRASKRAISNRDGIRPAGQIAQDFLDRRLAPAAFRRATERAIDAPCRPVAARRRFANMTIGESIAEADIHDRGLRSGGGENTRFSKKTLMRLIRRPPQPPAQPN